MHNPKWKRVSEARYWMMLGEMSPAYWNADRFLVGEPSGHRTCRITHVGAETFDPFTKISNQHYECLKSLTMAEFKALTDADILANLVEG